MSAEMKPPRRQRGPVPFSVVDNASRQALAAELGGGETTLAQLLGPHAGLHAKQRELWAKLTEECSSALALMGGPPAVGITSCLRGEGRSTIAIAMGLAQSFRYGRTTVLVEADLEKPCLAKTLGAQAGPGLADVLRGHAELDTCIQWIGKKLGLLPAGNIGADATRLLARLTAGELMDEFLERSDALVIDLPPFSGPGVGVARLCPKVILVVRADSTPVEAARRAAAELEHPAVIINRASSDVPRWMRSMFRERR
jgi:Mrp family chromosome partitioning ATPase